MAGESLIPLSILKRQFQVRLFVLHIPREASAANAVFVGTLSPRLFLTLSTEEYIMRPIDQMEEFAARRRRARATMCCASCGAKNLLFRDELSMKEYTISLLCQNCQDLIFEFGSFIEEDEE